MDFALSHEQSMLIATTRRFVEEELMPHEATVEALDAVPDKVAEAIQSKALALGLYAANMPEQWGGGGLSAVDLYLLERELGRTSYALHILVARPSNILQACVGAQVEDYLLPTIRGERHDCLAMTEPDAGSDVRSMRTTAVRHGDEEQGEYVLNGSKHFISHADTADYAIVFAATGQEQTTHGSKKKISGFLIDMDTPGLTRVRGPQCVSHRGYHQCELVFQDCVVPARKRLGAEHSGFALMSQWLATTRLSVAATSCGRAARALELATEWAATRQQFGQTIGRFQGVGFKLANMATELQAAECLCLLAAWKTDQGQVRDQDIAMAKLYATEALGRITDDALQIFGGMGLMAALPLERLWRDARVERIWDGTSEIQRHIIARALLRPLEN